MHDASRVEWIVSLPLPREAPVPFSVEVTIEITSNLFAKHAPWDQLQELARLDGPHDSPAFDVNDIDGLRRIAVSVAARLTRAAEGFSRDCRLVVSPLSRGDRVQLIDGLTNWLEVAAALATETRDRVHRGVDPGAELTMERRLVDEYVSVRMLEFLSGAERALEPLVVPTADVSGSLENVEDAIASALERELGYRAERGFVDATDASSRSLERYLDRASRLKKHFQEVLFLHGTGYAVVDRLHHVVAVFVALIASTWAFTWQLALAARSTTQVRALSGIVAFAVMAGVIYAVKDRIKEVGRAWVARRVHRLYAQRIHNWWAPRRSAMPGALIISARESIDEQPVTQPDPLNPSSGARLSAMRLCFTQRGTIAAAPALVESGITRVRQVFRYDLSPIFARLDDAEKPVPVLDASAHRVRIARAPRVYRFPARLSVVIAGVTTSERGFLVVHKRGLERFE